jgi:hypothetical protein
VEAGILLKLKGCPGFIWMEKDREDQRNSQNAVNSEFEENPNQVPDNMHNI